MSATRQIPCRVQAQQERASPSHGGALCGAKCLVLFPSMDYIYRTSFFDSGLPNLRYPFWSSREDTSHLNESPNSCPNDSFSPLTRSKNCASAPWRLKKSTSTNRARVTWAESAV